MTYDEFLIYADDCIEKRKSLNKKDVWLYEAKIDENYDVSSLLIDYYYGKNMGITAKKCPLKDAYDIVIWWNQVLTFLKEYDRISLFLDNDPNGNATRETIQKKYKNVEDCSLVYKDFIDLNEWFCMNTTENKF